MSEPSEVSPYESLTIDAEGVVILVWPRGAHITGAAAQQAFDDVNTLCGDVRRPMLVDMATTKSVARGARAVFGQPCAASRIALLGSSPVDRVIANFTLGVSVVPCPTRFFTDRTRAMSFLREGKMSQEYDDSRLDALVDLIVRLASGNLKARLEPSEARDSVDAVITGINLLAEELDLITQSLEQRVAERTMALDQARVALERMALNDALTGLGNRTLLGDRIRQAGARAERGARPPSVVLLDLDKFKTINDSMGHNAGDRILVEVARRLTSVVRETDTVARLGGDEFAIVTPDVAEGDALRVAERALAELQAPFVLGDRTVWTGASIGVCVGQKGQSAEHLLRDADTAMYAAKPMDAARSRSSGRRCTMRPRPARARVRDRRRHRGRATGVVLPADRSSRHCRTRRGRGVGAVDASHTRRADAGRLHPDRRGQWPHRRCGPLDDPSRRRAVAGLADRVRGSQLPIAREPVTGRVEIPGMATPHCRRLARTRGRPHQLAVEISETGMMTDDLLGLDALIALKELGLGIEIDDFGTGYSSISYLRRLPIDTVKVDQSLIGDLAHDARQVAFVASILRLIESVGLRAVVEGIETAAQLARLRGDRLRLWPRLLFQPSGRRWRQMTHMLTYRHIGPRA